MNMPSTMNRVCVALVLALSIAAPAPRPSAQLLNKEAPVIVGHYHLNVTSVAEHKKFWVDTLGGTAMKFGKDEVIKFPDVFLFLHEKKAHAVRRMARRSITSASPSPTCRR